jgi:hypothetical protein
MKALDMSMLTAWTCSGRCLVSGQVFGKAGDGGGVATLGDEHYLAFTDIGGDGQVIVAATIGSLIDRHRGHCRQVGLSRGEIHVARTDRMHAVHDSFTSLATAANGIFGAMASTRTSNSKVKSASLSNQSSSI